jgi:hypothetical protein
MNRKFLLLLANLLLFQALISQTMKINGTVNDEESGEAIIYASVFVQGKSYGTTTNEYGYFSLTVPNDTFQLSISYVGYAEKTITVTPSAAGQPLHVKIKKQPTTLNEITIKKKKSSLEEIHKSNQMGTIKLPMKDLKNIPLIAGETDIIKIAQLLPGVQGGGEGQARMFVRGGDADQNLIILDEAVVYNISHLFGFFSVFNADAIKDITLLKGPFPGNYGGRLSSVLDIRMNEGNMNKINASGGIGLLSSRLTIQAPIWKNKAAFMLAGRRTYIDKVFKLAGIPLPYYFYDLNAKLNVALGPKDHLYYSSYFGNDILKVAEGSDSEIVTFGFTLGNYTNTLRWNHIFKDNLFCNTSLINTNFAYNINGGFQGNSIFISSKVNDYGVKSDFNLNYSYRTKIKFGGQVIQHIFRPNIISTKGDISELVKSKKAASLSATEYAAYAHMDYKLNEKIEIAPALRISGAYVTNKNYMLLEPRLGVKYELTKNDIFKAGYSRMGQYMHLVSSSTVALPTDLWYPVTENMKPQVSDQVAVGYSRMFSKIATSLTVESYYKWMQNLVEYREGANLVLNDKFENEMLQGKGNAYGAEILLKRDEGRLTGWIGYTLSWTNRIFDELNEGKMFPAKYDRRHNFSIVANYKLTNRLILSAVWVYNSGARFTPQVGAYTMMNSSMTGIDLMPVYTSRNAVSMSPTHRLDVNLTIKCKPHKRWKGEWQIGGYNVYNSNTPYRIYLKMDESGKKYMQKGLFGFIPSVAYNFEF